MLSTLNEHTRAIAMGISALRLANIDVPLNLLKFKYGYSKSNAFLTYASILMHKLNKHKDVFAFIEFYRNLNQHYGHTTYESSDYFILGTLLDPWRYPYRQCIDTLHRSYQLSYQTGNLMFANYSYRVIAGTCFTGIKPLDDFEHHVNKLILFLEKTKIKDFRTLIMFYNDVITPFCKARNLSIKSK